MEDDKRKNFEEIVVPHFNAIYNFAYRLTGNRADTEDIVQDVFLAAYRFFHQFQEGTNCKAWLFKILKNTFINSLKKKKRENSLQSIVYSRESETIDRRLSVDFNEGFDETVQDALNKLPDEFRIAIILCDIEGLSYQEIAEIQECPVGTVRSRISRARRFLANELKDKLKAKT
jgi:RNA polymerase sigma-70 factor (ECF subfamily)